MSSTEKEKCKYCNSVILKKNLVKHQTSKKCLIAQENFPSKLRIDLEKSNKVCVKIDKKYNNLKQENEILKEKIKELEKMIEKLNCDKDKYFEHIVDIAKKPRSTNNTVNNTVIMTPLDMSSTAFSEKIANGFNLNNFLQGQAGVAKFAVNNLLRDDNGKLMYVCTNPSRHLFQFRSPHGVIEKDPKAVKLTEAISEEIRKKSSQISSTDDNLDNIGLEELMEQYNDIKEIGDPNKNTGFRNVLTGLTS